MATNRYHRPTDEEEAAIQRGIAADPDSPEWTEEDFANARPTIDVVPQLVRAFRRGRYKAPTKELISVRLDRDVLEKLRASGPGWLSQVNATLRVALGLDTKN